MESTGIYWKSPYAGLEAVGIRGQVVNARHVKNVPGCKTDIGDAQWFATLAQAGLLRGSFVPPKQLRELRLVSRQRQKLVGQLASEKNRLHKVLTDGGIRLELRFRQVPVTIVLTPLARTRRSALTAQTGRDTRVGNRSRLEACMKWLSTR